MTAFIMMLAVVLSAGAGLTVYQLIQSDFRTVSGKSYTWSDFSGQWVVLNYFAEWCAPCLREMPELSAFAANPPADTTVLAINYDHKTIEELKAMASTYAIGPDIIISGPETRLPVKRPPYLPATFIIGPDGSVADTLMGEVTAAGLRERLTALQSEPL
ncbi:TlpA family protein disulfide reductase [Alteromonas sp. CYL-A6]|uniref:TlpA family protein disulfide reductase n=1 Tax=Alteromonas nitratireducens TaxID=3390813 RepID=UPI0034AEE5AB